MSSRHLLHTIDSVSSSTTEDSGAGNHGGVLICVQDHHTWPQCGHRLPSNRRSTAAHGPICGRFFVQVWPCRELPHAALKAKLPRVAGFSNHIGPAGLDASKLHSSLITQTVERDPLSVGLVQPCGDVMPWPIPCELSNPNIATLRHRKVTLQTSPELPGCLRDRILLTMLRNSESADKLCLCLSVQASNPLIECLMPATTQRDECENHNGKMARGTHATPGRCRRLNRAHAPKNRARKFPFTRSMLSFFVRRLKHVYQSSDCRCGRPKRK